MPENNPSPADNGTDQPALPPSDVKPAEPAKPVEHAAPAAASAPAAETPKAETPKAEAPRAAMPAPVASSSSHDMPGDHIDHNIERHRWMAALSYVGILFLVPLLLEKGDEFVRFHLRQGLLLFAIEVVTTVFHYFRFGATIQLIWLVISVVGVVKALQGEKWRIPLLGEYAAKIKL